MKFQKTTGLGALRRTARSEAQSWRDPNNRPAEQIKMLSETRWTSPHFVAAWALTDDELQQICVRSNAALIAAGGVEKPGPYSHMRTFQHLGGACLINGWSIVPQDRKQRKPSMILTTVSRGLKAVTYEEAFRPTKWRERRMSPREFVHLHEISDANVAIQCCAASMNIRAIDVDCKDPDVARHIEDLAVEHLGPTPFVRIGAAPKLMMIYRVEGEEELDFPSAVWPLGDADGKLNLGEDGQHRNVIEFLAEGKMFTCYGLHHKTGRDFDWSRGTMHPAADGPEHAPVVTKTSFRAFIDAVHAYRPILRTVSGAGSNPFGGPSAFSEFTAVEDSSGKRIWTPKVSHGEWTADSEGNVIDHAEAWMKAHVWAFCAANTHMLDPHGLMRLSEALANLAKQKLLALPRKNDQFSTAAAIERAVIGRIKTAARKWQASIESHAKTGRFHQTAIPWRIAGDGRRPLSTKVCTERPEDGSLDWLPLDTSPVDFLSDFRPRSKVFVPQKAADEIAADKAARALIDTREQRKATGDAVSAAVGEHIGDWLESSVSPFIASGMTAVQTPWVLRAPTGAGKTVGVIDKLAKFCRDNPRRDGQGPILLVLPTHANGDEAVMTAQRAGMVVPEMSEAQVIELIESGKAAGVRIARFKGRAAAGCQRADELKLLQDKGIRSSDLCEKRVPEADNDERPATEIEKKIARREKARLENMTLMCPFKAAGTCAYWAQFGDLDKADIVIISHAYLTLNSLPKALKEPRAVIIDESTTYSLLQQIRFPVSVLQVARKAPYITKTDRKMFAGLEDKAIAAAYVQDREELAMLTSQWLLDGKDVAEELMKHARCDDLLRSAVTVCDRSHTLDQQVRPDLTPAQVADLADKPVGRSLIDEVRFWKIVRERIAGLRARKSPLDAHMVAAKPAKGERDMRWQVVMDWETKDDGEGGKLVEWTPHIRLSWRRGTNWSGVPMLLLDASANPRIIEKTYGFKPEVRDVAAPLHVRTVAMIERTWSNSSFIPRPDSTSEEIQKIAQTISEARRLITTTAVLYGHGRVLVGTTISVREVLTAKGWTPPPNIDFVHYGALRGLDFAKGHVAAISIGRSEQPIGVIDGYRAALTYDDDEPEEPFDVLGTGMTIDGKILFRPQDWQTLRMRSGQDVDHLVPGMRGKKAADGTVVRSWAQDLEESWREEEVRQFVGRLRPVYRGTTDDLPPPVWLAVGKILPEGIVVDELVEMQSMIKISPMAELVRLGGGVLADNVTPKLPGAQELLAGRDLTAMVKAVLPEDKRFQERFAAAFQSISYELASEPGRRRSALVLAGWIDGNPVDAWLALSERYGGPPLDIVEKPARLLAPVAKAKPVDKRDVSRDDQQALEAEVIRLHAEMDAEIPCAEFEIKLGRGDYLPEPVDGEAAPV